ncbi:MAG: N-acetyl-gamma-glutamyl-phosphate reductase [Nitrospirota bacterium]
MLKVAICGGSGYAGSELLRILLRHPGVEVRAVTSERSAGRSPADLFPHLGAYARLRYERLEKEKLLKRADFFFMALPHAASQEAVRYFFDNGKKVVDLSADFRLKDPAVYEEWYKTPHRFPETLKQAVYGLPERYREDIRKASLVANPGCYPTGALLGLLPLLEGGVVEPDSLVIDSKSGTSGAGRKGDLSLSFSEVGGGFKAYAVAGHRHTPEIEQELSLLAGEQVRVSFTPHLLPVDRGILSTLYGRLRGEPDEERIRALYAERYRGEPFVRVLGKGAFPNIKAVRGSNACHIGFALDKRTRRVVVVTALDNLVKGASGQAVECMNLMMGFGEETALESAGLAP